MSEGRTDGPTNQPSDESVHFVGHKLAPPEDTRTRQQSEDMGASPELSILEKDAKKIDLKHVRELLAEKRYDEALKATLPEGIDKEAITNEALPLFEVLAPILVDEYDKTSKDPDSEEKLQNLFNIVLLSGTNPPEAAKALASLDLSVEQKMAIGKKINENEEKLAAEQEAAETNGEDTSPEAEQRTEEVVSLQKQMDEGIDRMEKIAEGEVQPDESEIGSTPEERSYLRAQAKALRGRVQIYKNEFAHWINVPPRQWVYRAGKVLYYSAITFALLVLLEMHLIHKAAARK